MERRINAAEQRAERAEVGSAMPHSEAYQIIIVIRVVFQYTAA